MYKFKRVHIPTNTVTEEELKTTSQTSRFMHLDNRKDFLELVNDWNRLSLSMAGTRGSIEWLYVAL